MMSKSRFAHYRRLVIELSLLVSVRLWLIGVARGRSNEFGQGVLKRARRSTPPRSRRLIPPSPRRFERKPAEFFDVRAIRQLLEDVFERPLAGQVRELLDRPFGNDPPLVNDNHSRARPLDDIQDVRAVEIRLPLSRQTPKQFLQKAKRCAHPVP